MAIILPTSFSVQTQAHIDTRLVVNLLADRNDIAEAIRYWGMIVHVVDSTGANDAETYILNKFEVDDVISNNNNWAPLATIGGGSFWKTTGTTSLGDISVSPPDIQGDLSTDLNVSLLRFKHPTATLSSAARTDLYIGAGNGNPSSAAWGNIMFGQNNAASLVAVGEWQGGRNIFLGNGIANTWGAVGSNDGTHNFFAGRKVAEGTSEMAYSFAWGYEALKDINTTAAGSIFGWTAIGTGVARDSTVTIGEGGGFHSEIVMIGTDVANGAAFVDGFASILIGNDAGLGATLIEDFEILIGDSAGETGSLGRGNVAIGSRSMFGVTGGTPGAIGVGTNQFNVSIGTHTMEGAGAHEKSVFLGTEAGSSGGSGVKQTGVGSWTLNRAIGDHNTSLGGYAAFQTVDITGDMNTYLGAGAGINEAGLTTFNQVYVIGSPNTTSSGGGYRPTITASGEMFIGSIGAIILETEWVSAKKTFTFTGNGVKNTEGTFEYDGVKEMLVAGASTGLGPDFGTGAHAQAGSWSAIFGEEHDFKGTGAGGGRPVNILVAGWHHSVGDTTIGGTFSGASAYALGTDHEVYGQYATALNFGGAAHGLGSFVVGHHDTNSGGLVLRPRVLASGSGSTNISGNNINQTIGHGALAEVSAIFGGWNANIPADSPRSVVLGGDRIKADATTPDTVFVPQLRIGRGTGVTLVQNDAETQIAVIDSTTGQIKWRADSTLGGAGGGAFTADVDTQITPTAAILLDHATNAEIAFDLSGTVNKAAGTSNWIFANVTTTTGLNNFLDFQDDSASKFKIDVGGGIAMSGNITMTAGSISGVVIQQGFDTNSFGLSGATVTAISPSVYPNRADPDNGLGWSSSNNWTLVAGAVAGVYLTKATTDVNIGFNGNSFGSGDGVIFISDATTNPTTNPSGGGILYVDGIALNYRDTAGTITDLTAGGGASSAGSNGSVQVSDGAGVFIDGASTTNTIISKLSSSGASNAVRTALSVTGYNSAAVGGAGLGVGIQWDVETTIADTPEIALDIEASWYVATNGSEDSKVIHKVQDGGSQLSILEYGGSRATTLTPYFDWNLGTRSLQFFNDFVVDLKSSARAMFVTRNTVAVNTISTDFYLARYSSSGTPGPGHGYAMEYQLDNASSGPVGAARTIAVWETATAAAEYSAFTIETVVNGSINQEGLRVVDEGIRLSGDTTQTIKTVHLQLTTAQIQALNTTPIEMVAAPGSGKYIQLMGASAQLNHVTTAFTTGTALELAIASGTSNTFKSIASFIDNGANLIKHFDENSAGATITTNAALNVTADADSTGGGTSTIDVYVQYIIIDTN